MLKVRRSQPLANPDTVTRMRAYGRDHLRSLLFSLGKLCRQPFATTLTLLMIAVALALPACLYVLLNNLQQITRKWDDAGQITLFLNIDTGENAVTALREQLQNHTEIATVEYISADRALAEFRSRSQIERLLDELQHNPLPPTLVLTPVISAQGVHRLNQLTGELQALAVVDHAQLDMQWLQRLQAITRIVHRAISILGCMLAASVLLVVGNITRLDVESRREEIEVTKLVGATNRFVRRPFLYGGMWYGLLGGIVALFLVLAVLLLIKQPVQSLIGLYNGNAQFILPGIRQSVGLIAASMVLGLLGSWLAVSRYVARIEPT